MAILTSVESKDGVPEERVSGYNKSYSFLLKRADPAADYSILSLKAMDGAGNVPRSSYLWNLLLMPYATHYPHDHLVSSPGFALQGVSPLRRNGKNLLRVAFEWRPKREAAKDPAARGPMEGFFLVSPEEKWALYEFECRQKKESVVLYKGSVEYEGTVDGFPIPKKAFRQTFRPAESERPSSWSAYEFQEFRFADLPDKAFTLAAFGIAEHVAQPTKVVRQARLGYWFLALALGALAAAVLFKLAATRRRPHRGLD